MLCRTFWGTLDSGCREGDSLCLLSLFIGKARKSFASTCERASPQVGRQTKRERDGQNHQADSQPAYSFEHPELNADLNEL